MNTNYSKEPAGPGRIFMGITTSFLLLVAFLTVIELMSTTFQMMNLLLLVLVGYDFYHNLIGLKCVFKPTLMNLHAFKKSSKTVGIIYIVIFTLFFIVLILTIQPESNKQEQGKSLLGGLLIIGFFVFFFVSLSAIDYANYIIVNFWIYVTLQKSANQHPPPHLYDYENQFSNNKTNTNSNTEANPNNDSQIANKHLFSPWIQMGNENNTNNNNA